MGLSEYFDLITIADVLEGNCKVTVNGTSNFGPVSGVAVNGVLTLEFNPPIHIPDPMSGSANIKLDFNIKYVGLNNNICTKNLIYTETFGS
jgi:hypothetical protein